MSEFWVPFGDKTGFGIHPSVVPLSPEEQNKEHINKERILGKRKFDVISDIHQRSPKKQRVNPDYNPPPIQLQHSPILRNHYLPQPRMKNINQFSSILSENVLQRVVPSVSSMNLLIPPPNYVYPSLRPKIGQSGPTVMMYCVSYHDFACSGSGPDCLGHAGKGLKKRDILYQQGNGGHNQNLFKKVTGIRSVDVALENLRNEIEDLDERGSHFKVTAREKGGRHRRNDNILYLKRNNLNGSYINNVSNKGDLWMDDDCSRALYESGGMGRKGIRNIKNHKKEQLKCIRSLKSLVLCPKNNDIFHQNLRSAEADLIEFCESKEKRGKVKNRKHQKTAKTKPRRKEGYSVTNILSNVCVLRMSQDECWKPLNEMCKDIFKKMNLNVEGVFQVNIFMNLATRDPRAKYFAYIRRVDLSFFFRSSIFAFRAKDENLEKVVNEVMNVFN